MHRDFLYPLRCLHGRLHEYRIHLNQRRKLRTEYHRHFQEYPQSVFLVLTPEHGNLGDHAIAQAETELLTQLGIKYIEVPGWRLKEMMHAKQLHLFNGHPILINGGGNLGTIWMDVETIERAIFQQNPESPILVLPNTIYYEENDWGQEELQKSRRIYNHHKHLKLYAREKTSYDFMKPIYRDVQMIPDMVLSLKRDGYNLERKGCLLCMRGDRERTRTREEDEMIRVQAAQLFGSQVVDTDMVLLHRVPIDQREKTLDDKFKQFACAKLVITDRLHGMIFCAITGTPCIVIDSKSPKLRGCYHWIEHLDYIKFCDDPAQIGDLYRSIPKTAHVYTNEHLTEYFDKLKADILNAVRR